MKKTVAIIFTILSFILILDSMNAGHAVVMFFLAGIIPGTDISVSAEHMMQLCALLLGFVFARISMHLAHAYRVHRENLSASTLSAR